MSTLTRTWRNLRKIGIKEYMHQMMYIGDTKAGTYIATDRYGNKYYENVDEELPRTFSPSSSQKPAQNSPFPESGYQLTRIRLVSSAHPLDRLQTT